MTKATPDDWHIVWCVPEELGRDVYDLSTGKVSGTNYWSGGVLLDVGQSDWASGAEQTYNGYSDKLLGVRKKNLEPNFKIMFPSDESAFIDAQRRWWNEANSFQYPGTLRVKTDHYADAPSWREARFRLRDMNMSYEYHPGVIFKQREADAWMLTSEDTYWKYPQQWAEFSNKPGEGQVVKSKIVNEDNVFMKHPADGDFFKTEKGVLEKTLYINTVVPIWPYIRIQGPLKAPIGIRWTWSNAYDIVVDRDIASGETAWVYTEPRKRYAWIEGGDNLTSKTRWDMQPIMPGYDIKKFYVWSGSGNDSGTWQTGNIKIYIDTYSNTPF